MEENRKEREMLREKNDRIVTPGSEDTEWYGPAEQEIYDRLAEDAEAITVPDGLSPEAVERRLNDLRTESGGVAAEGADVQQKEAGTARESVIAPSRWRRRFAALGSVAAALVLIVAGSYAVKLSRSGGDGAAPGNAGSVSGLVGTEAAGAGTDMPDAEGDADPRGAWEETPAAEPKKAKVGDEYYLAADTDSIVAYFSKLTEEREELYLTNSIRKSASLSDIDAVMEGEASSDMAVGNAADSAATKTSTADTGDYAETNRMVEGVDEADVVKTDGKYLYLAREEKVQIVSLAAKEEKVVAEITPELGDTGDIYELYVDGDRLMVIYNRYEETLKEQEPDIDGEDGLYAIADVMYAPYGNATLVLATYDITDRTAPKLLGEVTQDGRYHTSRKVGDIVYLFSDYYTEYYRGLYLDDAITYSEGDSGTMRIEGKYGVEASEEPDNSAGESKGGEREAAELSAEDVLPKINGRTADSGCVYLPNESSRDAVIAVSVDIAKPAAVVDQLVVYHPYCEVYMGTSGIYLYRGDWSSDSTQTRIAKFSYDNGQMDAVDAVAVKGYVEDAFALYESEQGFSVLTTDYGDWNTDTTKNRLYLFDTKLKKLSSLDGIAPGEEIYAARYIGDIVYFVTYHNTDPLFAVDISDYRNPKLLGELKITGFSDYLHPYGENLLLGIGEETDPETSENLGIKLAMFDISDPGDIKMLDTVVLDAEESEAMYQYKAVLANPQKNIIGIPLSKRTDREDAKDAKKYKEYFEKGYWYVDSYQLLQWKDGSFVKTKSIELGPGQSNIRGLYAGDVFYHLTQWSSIDYWTLTAYDMTKDYKELSSLKLK